VTHEQYVNDKEADLEECIRDCVKNRLMPKYELIHVYEDDPILLDFLVAVASELDGIMIHGITARGEHSIRYPALIMKQKRTGVTI
jgi:hypothetical protein